MFVYFGSGKCPLCGAIGDNLHENMVFKCPNCEIHFNNFSISTLDKGIFELMKKDFSQDYDYDYVD